jgi:APA family basic amino acid/polyamine antiporter
MTQCKVETWISFIVAFIIGSLIYFGFGYRHSQFGKETEEEK